MDNLSKSVSTLYAPSETTGNTDYWDIEEYWDDDNRPGSDETHLLAWHNGLFNIPESAMDPLSSLTFLDCRYNKISKFPDDLACLGRLHHLDLTSNKLQSIPESIGILTRLRGLFLARNLIPSIPTSIGDMESLEACRLDFNLLIEIPFQVCA